MRRFSRFGVCVAVLGALAATAQAELISVSGPLSTGAGSGGGTLPAIIAAPTDALDDLVTNTGQQGFDEAQDVTTAFAYTMDSGVLAAGSFVDSHMIFLNSDGPVGLTHNSVRWVFAGTILGVMSDSTGNLEVASTGELGAAGTNYTVGPGAPPFPARGMEGADSYSVSGIFSNVLTVNMFVSEPGDWIRVITTGEPVPEPSSIVLMALGVVGVGYTIRRKRKAS